MEEQEVQSSPRSGLPRRDDMKPRDDVSTMVRLKALGLSLGVEFSLKVGAESYLAGVLA